jgi:hypothetical protein
MQLCDVPSGDLSRRGSGLEIFSQIVAMRKFGAVDGRIPICYKKRFAPEALIPQ